MPDTPDEFRLPFIPATEALAQHARGALVLLDLRKPAAVQASGKRVRGAETADPFAFSHDHPLTRTDRPVAVFCVHGHEVSRYGAALLRLHGREAAYVTGGFEALAAAGAPLETIE